MYCLLTRNLSRQCFCFEALHVALFKYLTHLGLRTSNHGPCCAASSFNCAKGNAQHSCCCCSVCGGGGVGGGGCRNFAEFFIQKVCCLRTLQAQVQGKQLHYAHPVSPCTVVYLWMYVLWVAFSHCDQWLWSQTMCEYTDASLWSSVYHHILSICFTVRGRAAFQRSVSTDTKYYAFCVNDTKNVYSIT